MFEVGSLNCGWSYTFSMYYKLQIYKCEGPLAADGGTKIACYNSKESCQKLIYVARSSQDPLGRKGVDRILIMTMYRV